MAAPRRETVRITGLREFVRALNKADKETRKLVLERLKRVGEQVRTDAARRFSPISARSAEGYRLRARVTGVFVEQSLRKTTGKHPTYGALQMRRALIPALIAHEADLQHEMGEAIDDIADILERSR